MLQHQYSSATHSVPASNAVGKGLPCQVSAPPCIAFDRIISTACTPQNGSSVAAMQGKGMWRGSRIPCVAWQEHQASRAWESFWEHDVASWLFRGQYLVTIEAAYGPASMLSFQKLQAVPYMAHGCNSSQTYSGTVAQRIYAVGREVLSYCSPQFPEQGMECWLAAGHARRGVWGLHKRLQTGFCNSVMDSHRSREHAFQERDHNSH